MLTRRDSFEQWLYARIRAQEMAKTPAAHDGLVGEHAAAGRGPDAEEVDRFCRDVEEDYRRGPR